MQPEVACSRCSGGERPPLSFVPGDREPDQRRREGQARKLVTARLPRHPSVSQLTSPPDTVLPNGGDRVTQFPTQIATAPKAKPTKTRSRKSSAGDHIRFGTPNCGLRNGLLERTDFNGAQFAGNFCELSVERHHGIARFRLCQVKSVGEIHSLADPVQRLGYGR